MGECVFEQSKKPQWPCRGEINLAVTLPRAQDEKKTPIPNSIRRTTGVIMGVGYCTIKKKFNSSSEKLSLRLEMSHVLSICSHTPEKPCLDELSLNKPVLPEIEHMVGKFSDAELRHSEKICNVADTARYLFSICCRIRFHFTKFAV